MVPSWAREEEGKNNGHQQQPHQNGEDASRLTSITTNVPQPPTAWAQCLPRLATSLADNLLFFFPPGQALPVEEPTAPALQPGGGEEADSYKHSPSFVSDLELQQAALLQHPTVQGWIRALGLEIYRRGGAAEKEEKKVEETWILQEAWVQERQQQVLDEAWPRYWRGQTSAAFPRPAETFAGTSVVSSGTSRSWAWPATTGGLTLMNTTTTLWERIQQYESTHDRAEDGSLEEFETALQDVYEDLLPDWPDILAWLQRQHLSRDPERSVGRNWAWIRLQVAWLRQCRMQAPVTASSASELTTVQLDLCSNLIRWWNESIVNSSIASVTKPLAETNTIESSSNPVCSKDIGHEEDQQLQEQLVDVVMELRRQFQQFMSPGCGYLPLSFPKSQMHQIHALGSCLFQALTFMLPPLIPSPSPAAAADSGPLLEQPHHHSRPIGLVATQRWQLAWDEWLSTDPCAHVFSRWISQCTVARVVDLVTGPPETLPRLVLACYHQGPGRQERDTLSSSSTPSIQPHDQPEPVDQCISRFALAMVSTILRHVRPVKFPWSSIDNYANIHQQAAFPGATQALWELFLGQLEYDLDYRTRSKTNADVDLMPLVWIEALELIYHQIVRCQGQSHLDRLQQSWRLLLAQAAPNSVNWLTQTELQEQILYAGGSGK